jgi:ditrans,polycis-polyprenyl diphosphate synthase
MVPLVLRRILQLLLKTGGSLPDHVAFIMDGNRRFASLQHLNKLDGHSLGYSKVYTKVENLIEFYV